MEAENVNNICIYDITGNKVYEGKETKIDISGLSRGIYIMKINLSGKAIIEKLILN